jgi:hypothetical protein
MAARLKTGRGIVKVGGFDLCIALALKSLEVS